MDNTLKSFNGHIVRARSVTGLNISGNKIEFSKDYPAVTEFPAINLQYSDAVTIKNNTVKGFDHPLAIVRSSDVSGVEVDANEGFEVR